MARSTGRRSRPAAEPLEGRQMLDAGVGAVADPAAVGAANPATASVTLLSSLGEDGQAIVTSVTTPELSVVPAISAAQTTNPPVKRFDYVTNNRTRVAVTLTGLGTLEGTSFDPVSNSLRLIYDNTDDSSQIVAHVRGGNGRANLSLITDADVPPNSQSGIGGNTVGLVAMKAFRLIEGGRINLNAGVRKLKLGEVGPNTQVLLRALPVDTEAEAAAEAGRQLRFFFSPLIGNELTLTDGSFIPVIIDTPEEPAEEPPNGIRIQIDRITGTFTPTNAPGLGSLGPAQVFGYDAAAGQLIRFDATTGAVTAQGAVPTLDSTSAGVSLGRVNGNLAVLVGQASTVRVFDALTFTPLGQFSTADLRFDSIDAMAKTDTKVAIVQGSDANGPGKSQLIDVTASLAAGQAVAIGSPYQLPTGVQTTTGATGVAGFEAFAATALATFDQFQPLTPLPGYAELQTTNNRISLQELDQAGVVPADPGPQGQAVGSVDQSVAINQGLVATAGGLVNSVTLVDVESQSVEGSVNLQYAAPLAGLSESYRPSLDGAALFDVQGDIQAFITQRANGLVLNDSGVLNLLAVRRMSNSVVLGFPVAHVDVIARRNVSILSTTRPVGSRGGVTVIPDLDPPGPLTLP